MTKKLINGIVLAIIISCYINVLHIFWYAYLDGVRSVTITLNTLGEFWFEFIVLNITFLWVVYFLGNYLKMERQNE